MMRTEKKLCSECRHFRAAPYQAKRDGCYHPKFMPGKQKDAFLDEQQVPGDHEQINRNGDCPEWAPIERRPSFLRRLISRGDL